MKTKETAVQKFSNKAYELFEQYSEGKFDRITLNKLMLEATEEAKEMEKNQHRSTADIFESEGFERCYYHSNHGSLNFEKWYNETYGGKNGLV
jgi:cobalamin biosynthesis Co2+ chelatase CbiK